MSLTRGDTLFAQNADDMMQPASTMKMYTSAVALDRFGPDFTFHTPVLRDGAVGADGTLAGNLYLRGVGDPSMSPRFWHDEQPMDVLAKQIAAAGIKRVRGDLIGDATAFDDKLVPDGWKTSYLGAAYAARVSALSLNENLVWVVGAARPAATRSVTLEPATTSIPVESTVRLVGGSRRQHPRGRGAPTARSSCSGSIGASSGRSSTRSSSTIRRCSRPARFAPRSRKRASRSTVRRDSARRRASATEVAALASPPLAQIIGEMDRESINIVAELLFRASAHAATKQMATGGDGPGAPARASCRRRSGRRRTSSTSATAAASRCSIASRRARWCSCSSYVHRADWGPAFHAALPVEGESGTLKRRAAGTPARGNLHAKTGTTNTVAALGGYVTAKNGEVLAFSLIYNGNDRWNAKAAMDQIGSDAWPTSSASSASDGVRRLKRRTLALRTLHDSLMSMPRFRSSSMYALAGMHSSGVCTPAGFTSPRTCISPVIDSE